MSGAKRIRAVPLTFFVSEREYETIRERMNEAGTQNVSAFVRKMALNGYVIHVDLSPVKELVSLQRRCSNNLNQIAIHANSFGIYAEDISTMRYDYKKLWKPLSDLLGQLAEITRL